MNEKNKQHLAICGLLIVTIIWGGGFVASDIALKTFSAFQILVVRFFLAALIMFLLVGRHIKHITKEEYKAGFFLGLFLFGGFALQIFGLKYTTPSKNAFLTATNVVLVPFIALAIYHKKVSTRGVIGAFMAICGAAVLSLQRGFSIGFGDSLTLLCAVCFAFQIFLTGEYVGKYRAIILNLIQMCTAFLLSFTGYLLSGQYTAKITTEGILSVLYLGIISTSITYLLQTISQRFLDETKAAIILSMEAVFGTLFSVVLLREAVTIRMLLGSVIILGAVFVSELKPKKQRQD